MFVLPGPDQRHNAGMFRLTGMRMHGGVEFRRNTQDKRAEKRSEEKRGDDGSTPGMLR